MNTQQIADSHTKFPTIHNKTVNQAQNRYVHVIRNNKGKFSYPNSFNQNSTLGGVSSIYQQPNRSIMDESIVSEFQTLKHSISQNKPSISIFKQLRRGELESQQLLKTVEKKNSYPLPNMKRSRSLNPQKFSIKKKIEKTQQVDNPCRPLLKQYIIRDPSRAIMDQNGFQIQDLKFGKTPKNVTEIKTILAHYITNNRKFFNKEVIKIPEYEKSAPFYVDSLKYADAFLKGVKQVEKEYGFAEENLYRNNLVLEKVMLERLLNEEENNKRKEYVDSFIEENSIIHSQINSSDRQQQLYQIQGQEQQSQSQQFAISNNNTLNLNSQDPVQTQ